MDVTAVIPNWNGRHLLESLLADLAKQTQPPTEIIVVDNGSSDGSADWANEAGARVIRFPSNLGFARAVNEGVLQAGSEMVAVLNNDIALYPPWIEQVCSAMEQPGSAYLFVTGKMLSSRDPSLIDGSFDALCRGGTAWRCGQGRPDGPLWNEPRDIRFPPFTAVLIRRSHYLTAGGLDESFGSYLEDVEFGLRCASKGHIGRYVPTAVALHAGSSTWGRWNRRTVRYISRNQVLLLARHYPGRTLLRFGWAIAVAQCLWGLVALRHGAGLAWVAGKIEGLRLWASVRRTDDQKIAPILGSSEMLIRDLQQQTGFDWYWRLYFALT